MAYDPNNPFQPFNTSPMSLLNVGGFRQPGDNQGLAPQNVFNQQQFNQNQQSNDLKRRQQLGNMLLAFSDVFRGKDPSSGVLQRQQLFRQQQEEEEQKRQQEELQKELNKAIDASNLPESQKELLKQLDVKTQASVLFEPEPDKQEIIDSIIRKIERGESLTAEQQKLYEDIVLRPTYQERLLGQFGGSSQSQPQPGPSIIPPNFTGTSDEWNKLKISNPNVSDEALVDWYDENYGS